VAPRVDAEGVIVVARWLGVVFAILQTLTYYRPFPGNLEQVAWGVNAAFGVAALLLTIAWLRRDRSPAPVAPERRDVLGFVGFAVDATFAMVVTWIYAFDADTAIFAILYVVALEGAFRYGMRGALLTSALLTVGYVARDVWAHGHYGTEIYPVSITFRMGICFLLAAVSGGMVEQYRREHQRLVEALERERMSARALRSLDELRSTFLAAVSHELRTPLTSILGFALTMQDRSEELSDESRMMLEQVVGESRHLEQLLQDLLDIERMGRGGVSITRARTDVCALVRALAREQQERSGRPVHVDALEDRVEAVVDLAKVERIVDNLLGNACKYSPERTAVIVHVQRADTGVLFVVDDDGPGVPESMRASIFEPFERGALTSSHQPGTGIGLSLVDRFARLHGGRAWVEPRAGAATGSSFHVFLPDGPEGSFTVTVADEPWGHVA